MESEANISQDVTSEEVVPSVEEAPVAEEETPTPEPETQEETPSEESASEPVSSPKPEQSAEADDSSTPAADSNVVIATEDVAPAQSRMNLARIAKEALVERARELASSTDWRKTSDEQRALMEEWRKAGYAGKEVNDKLWDEFRAARQEFFSHREEQVVQIKRQIIDEAKAAAESVSNWASTSQSLDALMERWKAAGNSGSESDKALWEEFNGIRRDFRNRRKADLDKRRTSQRENAKAKREIVDQAKALADAKEYTRENSDRMRQLDKDYKAIGFAGKPANDELWSEFSAAKHSYWTGNSEHMDQRRKRSEERLKEVVERKSDQIEHLKTQNETLTTRLGSTLDPQKIAQIKQWIAQNEERADDLADDINDIQKRI